MKIKNILRTVFAFIFAAGGFSHIVLITAAPQAYEGFADYAFFSFYTSLWNSIILPYLPLWIVLLILFEFAVSFLLLGKGKKPKIGLILAAFFCLVLVPFWWNGGAIINIILLFVILWLLRFEYPDPVFRKRSS